MPFLLIESSGRRYAKAQAAKTALFAAANMARYRKNRLRFLPMDQSGKPT
jgi:hypothetical protein